MELGQHSDESVSMRLVLLGPTGSGKTATANAILGTKAFPESLTTTCNAQRKKLPGRDIWVIDTPGLSESAEVKEEIQRSLSLGPPAPIVFLFLADLTKKPYKTWNKHLKLIEEIFGKDVLMHVVVLFTQRDMLAKEGFKKLLESEDTQDLIKTCGERYYVFNNKESTETQQVVELLENIEVMLKINGAQPLKNQDRKMPVSELRIVLLGKTGTGKSATGNNILGRDVFKEEMSYESVTTTCQRECIEVGGRHITVVDSAGLFDTKKEEDDVKRDVEQCLKLSYPGPHVFLLVIRLDVRYTEEEKNAVKWIQKNFGESATQFMMVLFTHTDNLKGESVTHALNNDLNNLKDSYGGRYHAFNNLKRDDRTQVKELLGKIDVMVKRNGGAHYTNKMYQEAQRKIREEEERRQNELKNMREERNANGINRTIKVTERKEEAKKYNSEDLQARNVRGLDEDMSCGVKLPETLPTRRIVLLGKTGSGKSATGNAILGNNIFKESILSKSMTKTCHKQETEIGGKNITVVDTPGLFDTEMTKDRLKMEMENCIKLSLPGPHAFLLVIRFGVRFTEEEKNSVKWIQENFGKGALKYTIVLFTHEDILRGTSVEDFLDENSVLSSLIEKCGGRYHVINNMCEDRSQVSVLMEKIDAMVKRNGEEHYDREVYKKAQWNIKLKNIQKFFLDVIVRAGWCGVGALAMARTALVSAGTAAGRTEALDSAVLGTIGTASLGAAGTTVLGAAERVALGAAETAAAGTSALGAAGTSAAEEAAALASPLTAGERAAACVFGLIRFVGLLIKLGIK